VVTEQARGLPWNRFEPWFARTWKQGQHIFVCGPTGYGKSNLVIQLLASRPHALALDSKGGDTTLSKLERMGFRRTSWPLPDKAYRQGEEGWPMRYIIGRKLRQVEEMAANRKMIGQCLHDVFGEGNWTVYIDELKVTASPKLWNLGSIIELNLIAARDRGVSIVTSAQSPTWIPRLASDQADWLFVFPTRDEDVVNRLAEMAGRPKTEIRGALRGLGAKDDHMVLLIGTDPTAPMVVTRSPLA
jgi:hypothetical protein